MVGCGSDAPTGASDIAIGAGQSDATAPNGADGSGPSTGDAGDVTDTPLGNLVQVATADGRFGTLLAAVDAASLTDTLRTEQLTLFAPTDEAFSALGEEAINALLNDVPLLTSILYYHLVAGTVGSETVVTLESATTLLDEDIVITVTDDGVLLNDSVRVTEVDIMASNGVIHVIDTVLLPPDAPEPPLGNIVEVATADGRFGTLLAAVEVAGLTETLGSEELTLFAPTDEAFEALGEETINAVLADIPTLTSILTYHLVAGTVTAETVLTWESATTLLGKDITIAVTVPATR